MHQAVTTDECLESALAWLRSSGIRQPNGGTRSVYDPATGRYDSWAGGRTCTLNTAGSVLVFLAVGDEELAVESGEHLRDLMIQTPGRFSGAILAGEESRYIHAYYTGFAIRALLALYHQTRVPGYLEDARRATRWVLDHMMQPDGRLLETVVRGRATLREALAQKYLAWQAIYVGPLRQLAEATGQPQFSEAANRLVQWLTRMQHPDGSVRASVSPWTSRLARAAYTRDLSSVMRERTVCHPTGVAAAVEAFLEVSAFTRAQRAAEWASRALSPRGLLYQYYVGREAHSVEEDVMPTALYGLTLLRHRDQAGLADWETVCRRIVTGLHEAQVHSDDAKADGGMRGLPHHPTEGDKVYCWDTQYSILFLQAWCQRET